MAGLRPKHPQRESQRPLAPVRLSKTLESSRGPEPSQTTIVPGGVNGGDGRIFRQKTLFSRAKIVSLQFLRPESAGFKQKLERVAVAGELVSPSTRLTKIHYDKQRG